MKKTNLSYNKSAKTADTVFGLLAIFGALMAPGAFLLTAVIALGLAEDVSDGWGAFGRIFLGGVLFTVIWSVLGIRSLIRADRIKKYLNVIGGEPRVKIEGISKKLKRPLRAVSIDLNAFMCRRYFSEMRIDMDYKEVIFDIDSPPLPETPEEAATVYEKHRGFPIWAVLAALTTLLLFLQNGLLMLVLGALGGVGAAVLVLHFFPTPVHFTEVKRTTSRIKRPDLTGLADLDAMLERIYDSKVEMTRLGDVIKSPKIAEPLGEILQVLDLISQHVTDNPNKVKNLRQFTNYYLPTTIDLLKSYEELEAKPDTLKGGNIAEAMEKIEGVTANMTAVFKREYDELFADKAMDISAEVAVMQAIIKESKSN